MSRVTRTLLLAQLLVVLLGLSAIGESQLVALRTTEPLTVTPPMPPAVTAAAAHPAPHRVVKPAPAPRRAQQHTPRTHVRHHRHRTVVRAARPQITRPAPKIVLTSGTAQQRMEQAVARIPGYVKGSATWVLAAKDGYWGTADWYHNVIYISPTVPANRMYDVVAHEWSHLRSVQVYDGDVDAAMAGMNRFFGGSGLSGSERAADCMARRLGATWTHYTPCGDTHWQAGAAQLLSGKQL